MSKWERARTLRYKKSALASLGWDAMWNEIYEIEEACSDVHWYFENDEDTLLAAIDGNEEETFEFKMAFGELEGKCELLRQAVSEQYGISDYFDDCTVALIGNRYDVVGFDSFQEDYFSLTSYEMDLATTEAGKRMMRHTKSEMLSMIGQCLGITLAFIDLRQEYDYLKATMDIIRDKNTSILEAIKEIEKAYETIADSYDNELTFDMLIKNLPEKMWLE